MIEETDSAILCDISSRFDMTELVAKQPAPIYLANLLDDLVNCSVPQEGQNDA